MSSESLESLAGSGRGGLARKCSVEQVGCTHLEVKHFLLLFNAGLFNAASEGGWQRNWEQLPGSFPCPLPLPTHHTHPITHSRVNTKEEEELSRVCSEITAEREAPVWRVGENRMQIHPFWSSCFIMGCPLGTVTKEKEVVEVTICCREKRVGTVEKVQ